LPGGILQPDIQPYVDGLVIPAQPSEVGVQVPAIFGTNAMEGTLFLIDYGSDDAAHLNKSGLDALLEAQFGPLASDIGSQYPLTAYASSANPALAAGVDITTDYFFKCPAYRGLTLANNKGISVWTYLWNHTGSCSFQSGISAQDWQALGPTHGAEIPFVFGTLVDLPLPNGTCNASPAEVDISSIFVNAWTSMAMNRNASTASFEWPNYNNETFLGINVGNSSAQVAPINYTICGFWNEVNQYILNAVDTNATVVASAIPVSPTITPAGIPSARPSGGSSSAIVSYRTQLLLIISQVLVMYIFL